MQFCNFCRFFVLVQLFATVVALEEDCSNAANLLVSNDRNIIIYSTPYSGYNNNTCGLSATCCSPEAEEYFLQMLSEEYQSRLYHNLSMSVHHCLAEFNSSHIITTTIDFVDASKSNLIFLVEAQGFQNSTEMFDRFFNYFENGIKSLDLCDIQSKYEDMILDVYVATFKGYLESNSYIVPTDLSFEQCLRSYGMNKYRNSLSINSQRLTERYNLFLRWMTALMMAEKTLSKVLYYDLTADCIRAILKLDTCAQCSGKDESIKPCSSFCKNTFRGCLVDIYELATALEEFSNVLDSVQDTISTYNPFDAVNLIQNQISNIIADFFTTSASVLTSEVGEFCDVTFQRSTNRKRRRVQHYQRGIRQATTAPIGAIDDTITCYRNTISMLYQLPDIFCSKVAPDTSNFDCWNGLIIGNYSFPVIDSDRISQLQNPTLCIRPNTGLAFANAIAEMKYIQSNLSSCAANVPGCDIKLCDIGSTAGLYNLSMNSRYDAFSMNFSHDSRCVADVPFIPKSSSSASLTPTTTVDHTTTMTTHIIPTRTEFHKSSTSALKSLSTSTRIPLTTNIKDNIVPDPDKEKINSSSVMLGSSFITIITIAVFIVISL